MNDSELKKLNVSLSSNDSLEICDPKKVLSNDQLDKSHKKNVHEFDVERLNISFESNLSFEPCNLSQNLSKYALVGKYINYMLIIIKTIEKHMFNIYDWIIGNANVYCQAPEHSSQIAHIQDDKKSLPEDKRNCNQMTYSEINKLYVSLSSNDSLEICDPEKVLSNEVSNNRLGIINLKKTWII